MKHKVSISLKTGKNNEENLPIRIRVTFNGQRVDFGTGYCIDPAKWDPIRQRVKNGCTNKFKRSSTQINSDLLRCEADIENIFRKFELQNIIPTPDLLKEEYYNRNQTGNPSKSLKPKSEAHKAEAYNLWTVFDLFVKESGSMNDWTDSTYEKFAAVKRHMYDFNSKLNFEILEEHKMNGYVLFLRNQKGLRNSTISKHMGFLKWFLRWANRKGYHSNLSFELFKPKLKYAQKVVVFLNESDIRGLKEYQIPQNKQYLERVRDVFLFLCFTGLRYSDVYNLRRSDIKEEHIEIVTIKTMDKLIIELNDHSKAILKKYVKSESLDNKALPVVSNQKMNDYLKELCQLAGINERITVTHFKGNERVEEIYPKYELIGTHTGRRSFICNALALGIPIQIVMKWTGHSDFKSMKPYIDVADNIRATAMEKFNRL